MKNQQSEKRPVIDHFNASVWAAHLERARLASERDPARRSSPKRNASASLKTK
jgi:hypothetical protein